MRVFQFASHCARTRFAYSDFCPLLCFIGIPAHHTIGVRQLVTIKLASSDTHIELHSGDDQLSGIEFRQLPHYCFQMHAHIPFRFFLCGLNCLCVSLPAHFSRHQQYRNHAVYNFVSAMSLVVIYCFLRTRWHPIGCGCITPRLRSSGAHLHVDIRSRLVRSALGAPTCSQFLRSATSGSTSTVI